MIDASAMVEWLQQSMLGQAVERRIVSQTEPLHAPHLLDIEVTHALRRHVRWGVMNEARAGRALWALFDAPCIRHEHYPFLRRIWELRDRLSPYDAVYVALAEYLPAELITCDAKLAGASGHHAHIVLIS